MELGPLLKKELSSQDLTMRIRHWQMVVLNGPLSRDLTVKSIMYHKEKRAFLPIWRICSVYILRHIHFGLGSILYYLNFVYFDFIPLLYLQFLVWTSVRDVKYIWLMILNGPSIAQVFSVLKIKIDICHWEFMMLKWHYSWSKSIPGQELYLAPRLLLSFRWKQTEGMANDLRRRIPRDLVVKVRLHRDLMYKMMRCFFNVVYLLVDC